jgi:hypothetical protein
MPGTFARGGLPLPFLAAVLVLLTSFTAVAADEDPVPVGLRKQLLVDDYAGAETTNVTRVLGTVEKANGGQPIFTDGWFYGTVLYDDGRFKLWYRKPDS